MSFSRWKMMAGVLGVSLGGLAAIAGQCPKPDTHRTARQAPDESSKVEAPSLPAVPSAGSGSPPQAPPTPVVPDIPSLPPPPVPSVPTPPPAKTESPGIPPTPVKELPPLPPSLPSEPVKLPELPASNPAMPPMLPVIPASGSSSPTGPGVDLPKPSNMPPAPPATTNSLLPPPVVESGTSTPPAIPPLTVEAAPVKSAVGDATAPQKIATVSKYRIVLRVGEGEPTFEVRTGDDLLLKVACEKVDIASPDKGTGPSKVTARGKVRFVGFGAEGTCQELSFWEGTGEVSLSGDVKIQVKDKLGRVESELSTSTMKYRIDPGVLNGTLKP